MFAFATFQAHITTDTQIPVLKAQGKVHHIVPTSLYRSSRKGKSYCGQIYMYEPDVVLRYRTKLGSAPQSLH